MVRVRLYGDNLPDSFDVASTDTFVDRDATHVVVCVLNKRRFLEDIERAWNDERGAQVHLVLADEVTLHPFVQKYLVSKGILLQVHRSAEFKLWLPFTSKDDGGWTAQGKLEAVGGEEEEEE